MAVLPLGGPVRVHAVSQSPESPDTHILFPTDLAARPATGQKTLRVPDACSYMRITLSFENRLIRLT